MTARNIAILGSTGSIGRSALAVVDAHADRVSIVGLAAGENVAALVEQADRFRPQMVAVATEAARTDLVSALEARGIGGIAVARPGGEGLVDVASHPDADLVLCASAGTAALEAALAAIEGRKTIALANKEVLVMAGELIMRAAAARDVPVLPVDSEHNAIHQCLHGRSGDEVRRLILTASGGPFRDAPAAALAHATPDDALRHPTWRMGPKITVDSATLMNKGLEVIEAHWLFGVAASRIDVLVHPQSIVHSLVELVDGSVIAQLGVTDMRLPIQYAFSYPARWPGATGTLDLTRVPPLEFHRPDHQAFPCLRLAYRALEAGGTAPAALNAANEVAVQHFLAGRIGFTAIPRLIEAVLDAHASEGPADGSTLAGIRAADAWAHAMSRDVARGLELKY
jgi:1-deoxy-D-xylulose-5-phosphate reductoisomerase